MQDNPLGLLCGLFCIYPLLLFGLPGFMIGKYWGRVKLRSPLEMQDRPLTPNVLRKPAPKPADKVGYGTGNQ
jgi:hypothetical protein